MAKSQQAYLARLLEMTREALALEVMRKKPSLLCIECLTSHFILESMMIFILLLGVDLDLAATADLDLAA